MGVVYAATHARNGHPVAVKVLHPDVAKDETTRARFRNEGYASNRVGHRGAVKVLDDGVDSAGRAYLVMERLQGRSLDAVAEQFDGRLPVADVVRYGLLWLDVMAS